MKSLIMKATIKALRKEKSSRKVNLIAIHGN
jgi:hypothetical protein